VKTTATTLAKVAFPQINCNVKETLWRLKKKIAWCSRKATFHCPGIPYKIFSCWLERNETRLRRFQTTIWCWRVVARDVKALCKKQMSLEDRIRSWCKIFSHSTDSKKICLWESWAALCRCWETSDFLHICKVVLQKQSVTLCFIF